MRSTSNSILISEESLRSISSMEQETSSFAFRAEPMAANRWELSVLTVCLSSRCSVRMKAASRLLDKAYQQFGNLTLHPMITGSGGLTLANCLEVPFTQEVIAVSSALLELAPRTDVAIELGGEDAKIIYFEGGNVEQRMNGICAGGTGSFIDQMASLIQTDAAGRIAIFTVVEPISMPRNALASPRNTSASPRNALASPTSASASQ